MSGWQHEHASPDIVTLAKGPGGGVPMSAMLASEHVGCITPTHQGGTFNGNPLMAMVR